MPRYIDPYGFDVPFQVNVNDMPPPLAKSGPKVAYSQRWRKHFMDFHTNLVKVKLDI